MLFSKYQELSRLTNEQKENPSKELEQKIQKLLEEIERILIYDYDSHGL